MNCTVFLFFSFLSATSSLTFFKENGLDRVGPWCPGALFFGVLFFTNSFFFVLV